MSNNIKILFWIYKARVNKSGSAPLMVRINYKGQRVQFSTGQFIPLNKWDRLKVRVRGKDENAHQINSYIQNTSNSIRGIFNELLQKEEVNLFELLNRYSGKNESS
ncbi:MAG: Arm DNA-binding domain-containing protein, partial [Bacteroidota bacterium]|nr:Arm DNA-binding domain-containing protein [Bacteroidota bacterium]